jgi:hypothetical protein
VACGPSGAATGPGPVPRRAVRRAGPGKSLRRRWGITHVRATKACYVVRSRLNEMRRVPLAQALPTPLGCLGWHGCANCDRLGTWILQTASIFSVDPVSSSVLSGAHGNRQPKFAGADTRRATRCRASATGRAPDQRTRAPPPGGASPWSCLWGPSRARTHQAGSPCGPSRGPQTTTPAAFASFDGYLATQMVQDWSKLTELHIAFSIGRHGDWKSRAHPTAGPGLGPPAHSGLGESPGRLHAVASSTPSITAGDLVVPSPT